MALHLKVPAAAGTVVGTALGAAAVGLGLATLPIALPAGAGAGVIIDILRRKHKAAVIVTPPPSAPSPAVLRMILRSAPAGANAAQMAASATQAVAAPPPAATALHSFLKAHPLNKIGAFDLIARPGVIRAFQIAFNVDPNAVRAFAGKQLIVDGAYDAGTAAALTFYTHDPIPADPPPKSAPAHAPAPSITASVSLPSVSTPSISAANLSTGISAAQSISSAAQSLDSDDVSASISF